MQCFGPSLRPGEPEAGQQETLSVPALSRLPPDLEQVPLSGPLRKVGWGWEGILDRLGAPDGHLDLK